MPTQSSTAPLHPQSPTMRSPNDTPSLAVFDRILAIANVAKQSARKKDLAQLLSNVQCAVTNGTDPSSTIIYPCPVFTTEPDTVAVGICADYYAQLKAAGLVGVDESIETDGLSLRVELISNRFCLTIKKFDYER